MRTFGVLSQCLIVGACRSMNKIALLSSTALETDVAWCVIQGMPKNETRAEFMQI